MWTRILRTGLFIFLLSSSLYAQSHSLEDSSQADPYVSTELEAIAGEMLNMADRWDLQQNLLENLTLDLETYRQDFPKLQGTLEQMQITYGHLRQDYYQQQIELKKWKTISLSLGIGLTISIVTAIISAIN